jgi:hypothetical protein
MRRYGLHNDQWGRIKDILPARLGFHLTGGVADDLVGADELLPDMEADTLIADKACDADKGAIQPPAAAEKTTVISLN